MIQMKWMEAAVMPVQPAKTATVQPAEAVTTASEKTAVEKSEAAVEKESGVKFELSEAGEAWMKQAYQQQAESAKQSGNAFRDFAKVMEIARRIARGDRVPAQDEKKLIEFDGDLYQAAKAAALVNANKKHKRHKSLFGDEDDDQRKKLRALDQEAGETPSGADTQTAAGAGTAESAFGDAAEIAEG